jgi:hypothetical protein
MYGKLYSIPKENNKYQHILNKEKERKINRDIAEHS